jgi:acetyl esterase
MALNPQVAALLEFMSQMPPVDYATVTPEALREANKPMQMGPPPAVAKVEDVAIALAGRTIGARLYVPEDAGERPPLVVFYHGGGWVIGSLETHDATARAIARSSKAAVLSVDYRLAPETPFPGPLDDCYEALVWAADNAAALGVDGSRLAVAGDSAGGNLAAAAAIRARNEAGPSLAHQLLIYPVADADFARQSYISNGDGSYFLSTAMMQWFWEQYIPGLSAGTPAPDMAAILRYPDLSGLPPATVIVAEYDPLHDEGVAFAEALAKAGVAVETTSAPGMIHGFFSMFEAVPDAVPFIEQAGARLREALAD